MNELPSADFRKRYARLTEPTLVTVNGHPIGTWWPGASGERMVIPADGRGSYHPTDLPDVPLHRTTQAQRDELLRKINRR